MMNILILYPHYNQKIMMHNFALMLKRRGILADVICIRSYDVERNTFVKWPSYIEKCFRHIFKSRFYFSVRVCRKITYYFLLRKLFHNYDLIDFHSYYPIYNHLMRYCVNKNIQFDIMLWGSDLMRATEKRRKQQKYGFDNCYRIKLSENLHDVMLEAYGKIYDDKCRIVYFGNSDFPVIDSLTEPEVKEIKQKLYGDIEGKKIVVCGYNGFQSQNHNKMIEALSVLNEAEKKAIHVVLPMTYGGDNEYKNNVRNQIESLSVTYTLLDTFLETKEVAAIRKTADIVINVQNSDAIAGSLQDHLYCGNVCIFGEWLNYSPYTNNGIFYIKTSMDGITDHLREILNNFDSYHDKCIASHNKIKELFSWETTIQKQVAVYGE